MTKQKLSLEEKIKKEILFLSDHWTKDDKMPFNFGGWLDEVVSDLHKIFKEELALHQKQSLVALRGKINKIKNLALKGEGVFVEGYVAALIQILSLLQDKLDNIFVIQPNPSKVGQDEEGSDIDVPTKEGEERGIDIE